MIWFRQVKVKAPQSVKNQTLFWVAIDQWGHMTHETSIQQTEKKTCFLCTYLTFYLEKLLNIWLVQSVLPGLCRRSLLGYSPSKKQKNEEKKSHLNIVTFSEEKIKQSGKKTSGTMP